MSDGTEGAQSRSGHLLMSSVNKADRSGMVPEGQQRSGYNDHGDPERDDVNRSRTVGGAAIEEQPERGYPSGSGTASEPVRRANDGVGSGFKRN